MDKKPNHRTPEQIRQSRAEDRQCDWEERLAKELPTFLNNTDQRIAEIVEERFDVPAANTLEAFATDHDNMETTLESIMRAKQMPTQSL